MQCLCVGAAALNQTPLYWQGNLTRITEAIAEARRQHVALLCLPELAITGYGCEDAFFMDGLQDLAFAQLERRQYEEASAGSSAFLKANPTDPLADNARYWLAETYYARADYGRSAELFLDAYEKSKTGPKAPDTLLKLGLSLWGVLLEVRAGVLAGRGLSGRGQRLVEIEGRKHIQ